MKFIFPDYEEAIKKLYGSLKRRYKLDYMESLSEIDKQLDDVFLKVVVVGDDASYSNDLINEINDNEEFLAYGIYDTGVGAYENMEEVYERIFNLLRFGENKFIFISLDKEKELHLDLENCIIVRFQRDDDNLVINLDKKLKIGDEEIIRQVTLDDYKDCYDILNKLHLARFEKRKDIFRKGAGITRSEFFNFCTRSYDRNAYVCIRDGRIVGFIAYEAQLVLGKRKFNERIFIQVTDIYVMPSYRRKGIGTRLFEEVKKRAKKSHCTKIEFFSWEFDEEMKGFISSLQPEILSISYEIRI